MTTMEERMSRLEGVIEGAIPEINQRLGSIEARMNNLEQGQADLRRDMNTQHTEIRRDMNTQFTEIRREMNNQFRWFIGTLLGVGVAILIAVLTTQMQ